MNERNVVHAAGVSGRSAQLPTELRLAVIGCGAVAESLHLPAIVRRAGTAERAVFVDPDLDRAEALCRASGGYGTASDHRSVLDAIDAALVTTPHHLHHPIARDCLRSDVHVLCEKPLSETVTEARELIEIADTGSLVLAVNNTRRLYPAFRRVRDLLASGAIGPLRRITIHWGEVFDWPAATGFYFGAAGRDRGVLADTGAHALDLVCWWLGKKPEIVEYADDSFGGSEAVSRLLFRSDAVEGEVQLSWLSKYENRYVLEGESGRIEGGIYDWDSFVLVPSDGKRTESRVPSEARSTKDLMDVLLDDFLRACESGSPPLVGGHDVLPSIELIDECYEARTRFDMPWIEVGRLAPGGLEEPAGA